MNRKAPSKAGLWRRQYLIWMARWIEGPVSLEKMKIKETVKCYMQPFIQTLNLGCKPRLLVCIKSDFDPAGKGRCWIFADTISVVSDSRKQFFIEQESSSHSKKKRLLWHFTAASCPWGKSSFPLTLHLALSVCVIVAWQINAWIVHNCEKVEGKLLTKSWYMCKMRLRSI